MITKEKFLSYYRVQMGGQYNMVTQATAAMGDAGLTTDEYWDIIENYGTYYNEFIKED